jgi:hypothetical protein
MITYSRLGSNGRLGNQMFQYAALFSVGFLRGYQVGIPKNQRLTDIFELKNANILENFQQKWQYVREDFSFDPSIFLTPNDCDIFGYFQSPMYFSHCRDEIKKEFKFKKSIEEKANLYLSNLDFINRPICSVHIRRGDYLNLSNYHTNLDAEYYQNACNLVLSNINNVKFLVFSDDPQWCKEQFNQDFFHVVDINDDAIELCVMSKLPVHVIANSSFSWWGAWLSNSASIIAPKKWFSQDGPRDWETIYENNWIKI